jgi:hypothetical protein
MSHMPPGDWKQLANKRPSWIQRDIEEAFWWFVDQKWRDSMNVATAEYRSSDPGQEARKWATKCVKKLAHDGHSKTPEPNDS